MNKYKNKNTGEILKLVKVDVIKDYPKDIFVYELEDGSRWNSELFFEHHEEVLVKDDEK